MENHNRQQDGHVTVHHEQGGSGVFDTYPPSVETQVLRGDAVHYGPRPRRTALLASLAAVAITGLVGAVLFLPGQGPRLGLADGGAERIAPSSGDEEPSDVGDEIDPASPATITGSSRVRQPDSNAPVVDPTTGPATGGNTADTATSTTISTTVVTSTTSVTAATSVTATTSVTEATVTSTTAQPTTPSTTPSTTTATTTSTTGETTPTTGGSSSVTTETTVADGEPVVSPSLTLVTITQPTLINPNPTISVPPVVTGPPVIGPIGP